MKPEKLVISGWGPYKDKAVIDFTKFHMANLFLITGQTGAGKTTIFDAIAYALYGVLSGQVREKGSVRSDFADENTRTYVELYMSHKGGSYHILRNPEYQRPKKKKGGESSFTKEKENAALTLPDGTIIAGNQDVTKKVEELLGMDGRQFCQISMIAQGEFARMLLAGSNEKTAIFRELFGTRVYADIQNRLKERSAKLYREYMSYKNKMDEDVRLLSMENSTWGELTSHEQIDFEAVEVFLNEQLQEMKKQTKEKALEEKKAEEELLALKEELERIRQVNRRFAELAENEEKYNLLQEKAEEMDLLNKEIQTIMSARLLSLEEKVVKEKEQAALECQVRWKQYEQNLQECKQELALMEDTFSKREAIKEAYILQTQADENAKQLAIKKEELAKVSAKLTKAREQYVKAQEVADRVRKQYEDADKLYKQAVIGIAARFVKEGEPCPVCGSVHHPNVARISDEVPDEKQLEYFKEQMETEQAACARYFETALSYQNEEKHLNEETEELRLQEQTIQGKRKETDRDILEYVESVKQAEFEAFLERYLENQSKVEEKEKQIVTAREEYEQKQEESLTARDGLNLAIKENGFASAQEYAEASHKINRLPQMEQEYKIYQERLAALKELCGHLRESLKDANVVAEEETAGVFAEKQTCLQTIKKELKEYHIKTDQIDRSLKGIRANRKLAEEIRREYGVVKDLDDLANGNNAKRLVFEQFVLASYFEQVLKAANLRLLKMTEGRYELIRAKQISDGRKKDNLEILVMDYYTGKERSVKTLSGGETFKASLALALGMSDCIQAQNGGLEVETLFIDEGFGALDEESLEQSCAVLQTLAGSNRMIGIISHVQELRERIDSQIIIEKKNFGSSIRIQS